MLVLLLAATAVLALLGLAVVLSRKRSSEDASRAYLAGVSYVLSDEPDAAIVQLSRAAQLNTGTYETYFALAALMRRKGELAWSIRLAQNMLLKPALAPEVRRRAQLELALDYRRAGLQDQSRETFERLLQDEPNHAEALAAFRRTLEESKDWERAAEIQERLVALEGKGEEILAHLLSERAAAICPQRPLDAKAFAARAAALAPESAHPLLALGEALLALGERRSAQAALEDALRAEPELSPLHWPRLLEAGMSTAALESWLQREGEGARGAAFQLALAQVQVRVEAPARAVETLRALVEREPRLAEARRALGELLLAADHVESLRADYRDVLRTLGEPLLGLVCRTCRAKLPAFAFRCAGCGAWDALQREPPAHPNLTGPDPGRNPSGADTPPCATPTG